MMTSSPASLSGVSSGSFDQLALLEPRAGPDQGDQVGPLTARQRPSAACSSLNTIASPVSLVPGPLVTLVLALTGENELSMGLVTGMKGGGCRLRPRIGCRWSSVGRGVRCDRPGQGHPGANAGRAGR